MNQTINALQHYLHKVLGVEPTVRLWTDSRHLPLFLTSTYDFYEINLLERRCLLMVAKEDEVLTPAIIKKHREQVHTKWNNYCIYVQKTITPYNRQRLIQHHVPFIVPGNQMHLPEVGIDLREYYPPSKTNKELLSPSTQAIVIYALHQHLSNDFTTSALILKFHYSRMTLIRAFNELEAANIGTVHRRGKERYWSFKESRRELWEQTQPLLRNPVKRRLWIKGTPPLIKAGLTALAERSLLSAPAIPIFAASVKKWKETGAEILPTDEGAIAQLEIWHYDPKMVSEGDLADSFSLYLSLRETKDERVEAALEEMMENIKW